MSASAMQGGHKNKEEKLKTKTDVLRRNSLVKSLWTQS